MRRRRHSHRRGKNHVVRNIVICSFVITLLFATGYSAFQTVISINAKGNIKTMYASDTIKNLLKSNSLTMFTDPFGNIRYTGSNDDVHNYVCLVDESPCQDKHLFRIIGSFLNINDGTGKLETRVKVVKAISYGDFKWNSYSNSNNWSGPSSINDEFNNTFFYSLDENARNIIGESVWNLGGFCCGADASKIKVSTAYSLERGNLHYSDNPIVSTSKIALMYPSDYGYASKKCYSNKNLGGESPSFGDSDCTNSNWLFGNQADGTMKNEWLLPTYSGSANTIYATCILSNGKFNQAYSIGSIMTIRPSFFFNAKAQLITKNHDGSLINPYVAKINT